MCLPSCVVGRICPGSRVRNIDLCLREECGRIHAHLPPRVGFPFMYFPITVHFRTEGLRSSETYEEAFCHRKLACRPVSTKIVVQSVYLKFMPLATCLNLRARFAALFSWKLVNGRECSTVLFYHLVGTCRVWIPQVGRKTILPVPKDSNHGIIPSVHSGSHVQTTGNNPWTHCERTCANAH